MKFLYCCIIIFTTIFTADKVVASNDDSLNISSATFSHWLDAAYIAQATYQSKTDLEHVLELQGYKITQYKQLKGFLVTYVLATNDKTKHQLLAVRGTSNIENMIIDSAFVLVPDDITGIDMHQGFLLSAKDIYQLILPNLKPGYKINTIGHSLGGAAALIVAMMLDAQGHPVDEVITFGQPKVTNISGSKEFSHLNIKRLVMPKDIVPLMPPVDPMDLMQLSIFWHQGKEIILFDNSQYAVVSGINSMMRALDFLNDVPSEQHINNHFMSSYIKNLRPKLKSSQEIPYKNDFKLSDWFGTPSESSRH
jgi:triacylglycerol lipase